MARTKGDDDEDEQRVIDDIHRVGWHIVGAGDDREHAENKNHLTISTR